MREIVKKAKQFSTIKHQGQVRKGNNQPYITHPQAVYNIAKTVTNDHAILASCWLHDTLEDTQTTYQELLEQFGREIADIVMVLTEDKTPTWEERKAKRLESVFTNSKAVIVAWADAMHNVQDLATVTDPSVFNRPIEQKLQHYQKFASKLVNSELRTRLNLLLDTYTISYIL